MIDVWRGLEHSMIDYAVNEWRERRPSIGVKGGH